MILTKSISRNLQSLLLVVIVLFASFAGLWIISMMVNENQPSTFSLEVTFRPFRPLKGDRGIPVCIVYQRFLLLVNIEDGEIGLGRGEPVQVEADASGAIVLVENPQIRQGEVAEITIIPMKNCSNQILRISIIGSRNGLEQTEFFELDVVESEDDLFEVATEFRNDFVSWLAVDCPEFGISDEMVWNATIVNPGILVVMHYMFVSGDWEMYVTWHVMVPPYDWVRVYLRPRFTETESIYAFEISSIKGALDPHPIELPDWI